MLSWKGIFFFRIATRQTFEKGLEGRYNIIESGNHRRVRHTLREDLKWMRVAGIEETLLAYVRAKTQ